MNFQGLNVLEVVDLNDNRIQDIHPHTFQVSFQIRSISLNYRFILQGNANALCVMLDMYCQIVFFLQISLITSLSLSFISPLSLSFSLSPLSQSLSLGASIDVFVLVYLYFRNIIPLSFILDVKQGNEHNKPKIKKIYNRHGRY